MARRCVVIVALIAACPARAQQPGAPVTVIINNLPSAIPLNGTTNSTAGLSGVYGRLPSGSGAGMGYGGMGNYASYGNYGAYGGAPYGMGGTYGGYGGGYGGGYNGAIGGGYNTGGYGTYGGGLSRYGVGGTYGGNVGYGGGYNGAMGGGYNTGGYGGTYGGMGGYGGATGALGGVSGGYTGGYNGAIGGGYTNGYGGTMGNMGVTGLNRGLADEDTAAAADIKAAAAATAEDVDVEEEKAGHRNLQGFGPGGPGRTGMESFGGPPGAMVGGYGGMNGGYFGGSMSGGGPMGSQPGYGGIRPFIGGNYPGGGGSGGGFGGHGLLGGGIGPVVGGYGPGTSGMGMPGFGGTSGVNGTAPGAARNSTVGANGTGTTGLSQRVYHPGYSEPGGFFGYLNNAQLGNWYGSPPGYAYSPFAVPVGNSTGFPGFGNYFPAWTYPLYNTPYPAGRVTVRKSVHLFLDLLLVSRLLSAAAAVSGWWAVIVAAVALVAAAICESGIMQRYRPSVPVFVFIACGPVFSLARPFPPYQLSASRQVPAVARMRTKSPHISNRWAQMGKGAGLWT
ncbi:unnamed protein product [Phaeothamnion confervicola]